MIDKELLHQAAEDIDIFQADLTEEYERLCKPQPRKLRLWPLAVAACVAGIVAIFLVPPKETKESSQVTSERDILNFPMQQYEVDQLMAESFEEHQQRIKKKGERLAAYISQELKDYDNKVQL
jgi:negative regulator of sigma E activity